MNLPANIVRAGPTNANPGSADRSPELHELLATLDIGDEYLWNPDRIVPYEHWVGHIPFVFWLIKSLRPRYYVELGTHRGNSYCAMCQAVQSLRLGSTGYAVDTWQGDGHMAFEGGLLEELRTYHDLRYGAFSTLMPMTFDDARLLFSDNSLDLLHIDGTHTYEAVRHDFENWLPTLSNRAVVLFHDTNVRRGNFGVWRLWEELSVRYPAFTFSHSYGLGVLGVGTEQPDSLLTLFGVASNPREAARVRALFALRGEGLISRLRESEADARQRTALAEADEKAALRTQAASADLAALRIEADQREETLRAQAAAELKAARAEADEREAALRARATAELNAARARTDQRGVALRAQAAAELNAAIAKVQREIALRANALAELKAVTAKLEESERARQALTRTAEATAASLNAIEQSTIWRALYPARSVLNRFPASDRRFGRRVLRVTWRIVTLQLLRRIRKQAPSWKVG